MPLNRLRATPVNSIYFLSHAIATVDYDVSLAANTENFGGKCGLTVPVSAGWSELRRRGPALVWRLRLVTGLIMFAYVFLHFVNHSLANISFETAEQGAVPQEWLWRGPIGSAALYGGFAIHFSLALWAFYTRRSLRMGWIEAVRLALGFVIPLLLLRHVIAWRFAYTLYDVHLIYRHAFFYYFTAEPMVGVWQMTLFFVAWIHGCIGIYLWLRVMRHFHRFAPVLLVIAVVLPTAAVLGIYQGQREVAEKIRTDQTFTANLRTTGLRSHPEALADQYRIGDWCFVFYAGALVLLLAARGIRALGARRGGRVRVAYPDGRTVRIPKGLSVLDASRRGGIPHASICGGRARCTTCRVRVLLGSEHLGPPSPIEARVLRPLGVDRAVRLACQLKPSADISVWPLLPPEITMRDRGQLDLVETGAERRVAILFVDIRSSTQLVENRLPFDVVFVLNRFFEAVGSAITAAGGMPNQFIGDGMMAIFGTDTDAAEACRRALRAAQLIDWHLTDMNRALANELQQPIVFGVGIHAGEVIIGTMGYRQHAQMTAIGEAVHVASRLQELTKEYQCQLVVSDVVGATAGVSLDDFPAHQIQLRGLSAALSVRAIRSADTLPLDRFAETGDSVEDPARLAVSAIG